MYSWKHNNIMIPRTIKCFWSVKSSFILYKRSPPHFYTYQQANFPQKLDNRREGEKEGRREEIPNVMEGKIHKT